VCVCVCVLLLLFGGLIFCVWWCGVSNSRSRSSRSSSSSESAKKFYCCCFLCERVYVCVFEYDMFMKSLDVRFFFEKSVER